MTYNLPQTSTYPGAADIKDSFHDQDRQLLTVIFTDIKGFSSITEKNETHALARVQSYREIVCAMTERHQGTLLHFYGDGSLSVHKSAVAAVRCAVEMQRAFAEVTGSDGDSDDAGIPVRIGIHLGEVVVTADTVYGNAVNVASRLQELAYARSILISGAVARELTNHPEIELLGIGRHTFKNISDQVEVFAVKGESLVIPKARFPLRLPEFLQEYSLLTVVLAVATVLVFLFLSGFQSASKSLLDERVVVLPFENRTGDPAYDDFSGYAAAFVSRIMEEEDAIKIASARDLMEGDRLQTFSTLPLSAIKKRTNAENFIRGYFSLENDSTLRLSSALVDGRTGEIIQQFEDQLTDAEHPNQGLVQVVQHIVGFLLSAEFQPLTVPTDKAFKAYMEALRVYGKNNYADSRQLTLASIGHDSTFLDAYITLCDTYYNTAQYERADSVMDWIKKKFSIESLNGRQRNMLYFYDAFGDGHNSVAYKYLLNDYHENEEDMYRNTTAASYSLFFVNAPERALKILKRIPFDQLDLELPNQKDRMTIATQAHFALGHYRQAYQMAKNYPSYATSPREHRIRIRAFAGVRDTSAIQDELTTVSMNYDHNELARTLYWTSQQFQLLGQNELAHHYLRITHDAIVERDILAEERSRVMYDLERYQEGLDHALYLYDFAPHWVPYAGLAAYGYALTNNPDSALAYCKKMRAIQGGEQYRGQVSYLEATVYTALGDDDGALVKLQNAIDEGFVFYEFNMEFDPRLMPLFEMEEFQSIVHPLK